MDHREESKHDAIRREFTRGHAYGLVERNKTRDRKLPRSVQTIVQVKLPLISIFLTTRPK